jgi:hypothetical protein
VINIISETSKATHGSLVEYVILSFIFVFFVSGYILTSVLANGVDGIDSECQDFGFDFGVAKWQCNGGWSIDEEIVSGTSVTGSCDDADWSVGSSGADGIVVKAGSTVHYAVVGTSGTVEQSSPDISHITLALFIMRLSAQVVQWNNQALT